MDRQGDDRFLEVEKMLWEWESSDEGVREFAKRLCAYILPEKAHEFLADLDG